MWKLRHHPDLNPHHYTLSPSHPERVMRAEFTLVARLRRALPNQRNTSRSGRLGTLVTDVDSLWRTSLTFGAHWAYLDDIYALHDEQPDRMGELLHATATRMTRPETATALIVWRSHAHARYLANTLAREARCRRAPLTRREIAAALARPHQPRLVELITDLDDVSRTVGADPSRVYSTVAGREWRGKS